MDIYLIHYFFLPKNGMNKEFANAMFNFFEVNHNIALEIVTVIVMCSLIIAVSLGVSQVLRKNKFLGYYLFGAKERK